MPPFCDFFAAVPYCLPGTFAWGTASLALAPRAAKTLGLSRWVMYGLLVSLGLVILATLTPKVGTMPEPFSYDFRRVTPPTLTELAAFNDTMLNVILFMPLGLFLGLLPKSSKRTIFIVFGYALPVVIETLQFAIPPLGRGCQSADVIDNAIGLTVGLGLVAVVNSIRRCLRHTDG